MRRSPHCSCPGSRPPPTTLEFEYADIPYSVDAGGWVITGGNGHVTGVRTPEDFAADLMLFPKLVEREGTAVLPAGGVLPAEQDPVEVTLDSPMLTTGWIPDVSLRGNVGLLSGHSIVTDGVTVTGPDTVEVTVYSGALAPAGVIHVVGREVV